jgi:hypothetical protein
VHQANAERLAEAAIRRHLQVVRDSNRFVRHGTTLQLSGINVQIVSGSGATDGAVNGRGNLIVGYNAASSGQTRTGSHNVVVGDEHEYTSYGGLVAGFKNTSAGPFASVSGGRISWATGTYASVSGGVNNTASGDLGEQRPSQYGERLGSRGERRRG